MAFRLAVDGQVYVLPVLPGAPVPQPTAPSSANGYPAAAAYPSTTDYPKAG